MNTKPVCQLDHDGYFVGMTVADASPLEPGVWLLPAGAIDADAPEIPEGYRAKWTGAVFELEALPVDPDPEPEPEPPTLAERREAVWTAVKVERARREYGGVLAAGHWFQTDLESQIKHQSNLIDAKDMMASGGTNDDILTIGGLPVGWKTYDNGVVPLTVGLAVAIAGAIKVQTALAYARGEQLRAQIEVSDDPESIDITTGWPPVYGG